MGTLNYENIGNLLSTCEGEIRDYEKDNNSRGPGSCTSQIDLKNLRKYFNTLRNTSPKTIVPPNILIKGDIRSKKYASGYLFMSRSHQYSGLSNLNFRYEALNA